MILDGDVVNCNAGGYRSDSRLISPYFSPDESSRAFPIIVENGEYALWHDGDLYKVQTPRFPRMIGWLHGNVSAWAFYDENEGWLFRVSNGPVVPTMLASMVDIFVGPQGSFACFGTPCGEKGEYPRILVKDSRVLQQADFFQIGNISCGFGFSVTGRLIYAYAIWMENGRWRLMVKRY